MHIYMNKQSQMCMPERTHVVYDIWMFFQQHCAAQYERLLLWRYLFIGRAVPHLILFVSVLESIMSVNH